MILRDLKPHSQLFTEYTELRVQENRNNRMVLVNGDLRSNVNSAAGGISVRVFKNGSWGFASSPHVTAEGIKSVIKASTGNATFMSSRNQDSSEISLPSTVANYEMNLATKAPKNSNKHWMDFLKTIDDYIVKNYTQVSSRTIALSGLDMEKSLLTSTGSESYSMTPRAILYLELVTMKDGEPIKMMGVYGGLGELEDRFNDPSTLFDDFDQQVEHLQKKAEGVYPQAGEQQVILDADLAGILAHEAIGHTTEADGVLGGSIAGEYMDQLVATPLVTLVDFANTFQNKLCPVPLYVDDEGTKCQDTVIIEEGVLKSYMHNKDSARRFDTQPTGNARAYQFSDEPLIRMRNTAILPGKDKLDDMIASIEDGYYLIKPSNGQADSNSEFMFGITLGYEIKKGQLGKAIRDTTIAGVAFDMLKTIEMVSDDMSWTAGGMCGKKQLIPVGMGGPAVKCKINIGGR